MEIGTRSTIFTIIPRTGIVIHDAGFCHLPVEKSVEIFFIHFFNGARGNFFSFVFMQLEKILKIFGDFGSSGMDGALITSTEKSEWRLKND
jgi:hypothetical protein